MPLRHGLAAIIVRYAPGEERPERPARQPGLSKAERDRQTAVKNYERWLAHQRARGLAPSGPDGGAA
ncbi:hypothetical protein [Janibacter melonis]|uniref:hypothetical protein n=1 Tax=Janibacter melonis TaxID=262209 RepID=UPI00177E1357|nr:hypothetical protein [Janibacter melonis]